MNAAKNTMPNTSKLCRSGFSWSAGSFSVLLEGNRHHAKNAQPMAIGVWPARDLSSCQPESIRVAGNIGRLQTISSQRDPLEARQLVRHSFFRKYQLP